MSHKRIRIPKDIVFDVMNELGKLEDAVEFLDINQKKTEFDEMIKRCDTMEKRIS